MFFKSVGVVGWAYRSALVLTFRFKLWLPFLFIALAQGVILIALVYFHRPGISPFMFPVVRTVGGETATHYPAFFFYLPLLVSRVSLLFAVLGTSIAVAAATLLFADAFGHRSEKKPWGYSARRYPTLFVVAAILAAGIFGISQLSTLVPHNLFQGSRLVRWGTRAGLLFLFVVVQSFLVYATAWIVLRGHKVLPAMRDSIRVTARTFVPTFLIVAIPVLILFPLDYLAGRTDLYATKLNPEMTAGILGLRIVIQTLFSFLLVGAVTRLFLWRMESAR